MSETENNKYRFKKGREKTGGRSKGTLNKKTVFLDKIIQNKRNQIEDVFSLLLSRMIQTQESKLALNEGRANEEIPFPVSDEVTIKLLSNIGSHFKSSSENNNETSNSS